MIISLVFIVVSHANPPPGDVQCILHNFLRTQWLPRLQTVHAIFQIATNLFSVIFVLYNPHANRPASAKYHRAFTVFVRSPGALISGTIFHFVPFFPQIELQQRCSVNGTIFRFYFQSQKHFSKTLHQSIATSIYHRAMHAYAYMFIYIYMKIKRPCLLRVVPRSSVCRYLIIICDVSERIWST